MLMFALAWALWAEQPDRTPSIYRCPTAEAESPRFEKLLEDEGFSLFCIEPRPGPNARKAAQGKAAMVSPAVIDTAANRRWRDATIALSAGKISPKEWLARTRSLHETVHFLSSPATPPLQSVLTDQGPAVFAEILMLSWPGKPCLTSGDIWRTHELPGPGPLESWILAMNDWMGPMLQYRHDNPFIITNSPVVIRADARPGLLIFRQQSGKKALTFYFNCSKEPVKLPSFKQDAVTINRGLTWEDSGATLQRSGFFIETVSL